MPSKIAIKPFRGKCRASVRAPGSKSITNRALLLAVLAGGKTVLNGALFSRDTLIMADCLSRLGYVVSLDKYENKFMWNPYWTQCRIPKPICLLEMRGQPRVS
ncbi:MAG: hypothetical protein ACLUKN_09310 [Bacilli bacterium]